MTVSLLDVSEGGRAIVVDIWEGIGAKRRLLEMGLTPGSEVEVVSNCRGPVVVRVRGVTVALSRGVAGRIRVKPAGGGDG
ncbi:MAG: ferrous iron transport protein A [Thermofilaceae archaeon]|nr:ferrous iron transport protein A [Thermofilaceae archaeon]MCX8180079.1 ferrous iron transport protein A [Thermofilaceae archaeon]MDW8004266.1 ferrous iron transport protein A [Thermofilaceae archaeon]